jgi:hypothetical protein
MPRPTAADEKYVQKLNAFKSGFYFLTRYNSNTINMGDEKPPTQRLGRITSGAGKSKDGGRLGKFRISQLWNDNACLIEIHIRKNYPHA